MAAELVGTGPQNLRAYERHGPADPERTEGGTRRYSPADLDRLRHIGELLAAGLNLAGIAAVLDLEAANNRLSAALDEQPRRSAARSRTQAIGHDRPGASDPDHDSAAADEL